MSVLYTVCVNIKNKYQIYAQPTYNPSIKDVFKISIDWCHAEGLSLGSKYKGQ